jgi:hypothetical protein
MLYGNEPFACNSCFEQYNLVWPILSVNTMQNMRAITSTNDEIAELINIFPPNFPIFNVIP